jgi:hypothetical protein
MTFRVGGRPVLVLLFAVFCVIGLSLTATALGELTEALRLRREGQTVDAVVVNKDIRRVRGSKRTRVEHTLRYRFQVGGTVVGGEAVVDADEWERRQVGDRVAVRYLPSAPDVSRVADGAGLESPIASVALGSGVVALFGTLLGRQVLRIRRDRRIRREGMLADATVVAVEETRFRVARVVQWRIRYRYRDHLGQAREGDTGALPPGDVEGWQADDAGKVRFDRARPQDSVWIGHG